MCETTCGCTIITRHGRERVLKLLVDERYFRLTHEGDGDILPGSKFFDRREFEALWDLVGADGARGVFDAVRRAAEDTHCIPEGLELKLTDEIWQSRDDGGHYFEIIFVEVIET